MLPSLHIAMRHEGLSTRFIVEPRGEAPIGRLMRGYPVNHAMRVIPVIFNLCPMAQGAAASMAMGLEPQPDIDVKIALETLREHALVMLKDWPSALRSKPDSDGLMGLAQLSATTLDRLEQVLFGAPAKVVFNDFGHWMQRSSAGPAIDLATVNGWPKSLGKLENFADPTFLHRVAHYPAIRDIIETEGRTLFARMSARAVETALLIESIREESVAARCGRLARGEGWAEAARGRLTHSVRLRDGLVESYRINTPTDGMAGDGAFLEALLQSAYGEGDAASEERLAIAMTCADPCTAVVWNNQASANA